MKILRKIKVRSNKIFAYFSLFSMVANTLSPFAAMIPASAYAEDIGAPVEVIVEEKEPEEEPGIEADAADIGDAADGQDLTVEEETNGNEITDEGGEEDGVCAGENEDTEEEETDTDSENVENDTGEIDPEAPDIYIDGATTTNPLYVIEEEEVVEVEEIPTPFEDPVVEAEESEEKDYETLADGAEIKDSAKEDWNVDEEKAETKEKVKIGIKYIFPIEEDVSITFTKLPKPDEDRSKLKIERVKVSDLNLPDDFKTDAEYAFDITTDMENGEFEYDITLPKPEGVDAEVSYIEKSIEEAKDEVKSEDVKKVKEDKLDQEEGDSNVKISDLDHFTIFVVVAADETLGEGSVSSEDSAWISDNSYASFDNKNDWVEYGFPSLGIPSGADIEGIEVLVEGYTTGRDLDIAIWNKSNNNPDAYTSFKEADLSNSDLIVTVGGSTEKWGKTWDSSDFGTDFKVMVDARSDSGDSGTAYLDQIKVKVYYSIAPLFTPPTLSYDSSDDYALTSVSGIWTDVSGGSNVNGEGTEEVRWGNSAGYGQSGLRFDGSALQSFNEGYGFYLGALTHFNWPITSAANGATLKITLQFLKPGITPNPEFTFDFNINETPNSTPCAAWHTPGHPACDDKVTFPSIYGEESFTIGDKLYTLKIDGFVNAFPGGSPVSEFITEEQKNNTAFLVGSLSSVLVDAPHITLNEKAVENDDADVSPGPSINVGDTADFTYIVQNTGNVTLTDITVVDDKGVIVTCPKTTLESGELMTCTGSSTAILGLQTNTAYATGKHSGNTYTSNNEIANYTGISTVTCGDGVINQISEQCDGTDLGGLSSSDYSCNKKCELTQIEDKVTICHATDSHSNPYNEQEPNKSGDVSGHADHTGPIWYPGIADHSWGDIIPPFDYLEGGVVKQYAGLNWTAEGEAILENDCEVPETKGSLSGYKWHDLNGDGLWDNGEPGYDGFEICIDQNNSSFTDYCNPGEPTVLSGQGDWADGYYEFTDLVPGTYRVCEEHPAPTWVQTYPSSWGCHNVVVTAGQESSGNNFGNAQYTNITGWKWNDSDGDGIWDDGESAIKLGDLRYKVWTKVAPDTYSEAGNGFFYANGSFEFPTLPGTYWLSEYQIPAGWMQTHPDENAPTTQFGDRLIGPFVVTSGTLVTDANFGNVEYGSITGAKWEDLDGNGEWNGNEIKSSGWEIQLKKDNQVVQTDITDTQGFEFLNVAPGTYEVCEVSQPGWAQTYPGGDSCHSIVSVVAGQETDDIFFGNMILASCGDGIANGDEQCDNGSLNGQSHCSTTCEWVRTCDPEMLANGSFESPVVDTPQDWDIFTNGMVSGWTAEWYNDSGNRPEVQIELHAGVNGWTAKSGNQYTELDSDWDGPAGGINGEQASVFISQKFPTIVGNEYSVSWSYSARPGHSDNRLGVYVNETPVFDSGNVEGGGSVDWQDKTHTFTATEDVTKISFAEWGTPDSYGMFLDNVRVECLGVPTNSVTVCKQDQHGNPLSGWKVGLSQPIGFEQTIPVGNGDGVSTTLGNGAYVVFASGTYRYGNDAMIADAGYSFRPVGIPMGTGGWVSGDSLDTAGALELKLSGGNITETNINWGAFNPLHQYSAYLTGFEGDLKLSIWDNVYGDNINNGNFRASIDRQMFASGFTGADGCNTFMNVPYGDYHVFEVAEEDWSYQSTTIGNDTFANYPATVTVGENVPKITITNQNSRLDQITIIATKIVCDNESDLPNYGYGALVNITENTASNWIASHPNCRLEPDWSFQWGDDGDINPSDSLVGVVAGWNTFGPTNSDGTAVVEINDFGDTSQIKVREVLKENYIPFTYLTNESTNKDNVSAEIYCHTDVLNYDNDDRFTPEYGNTYYCVAWNVEETYDIHGYKFQDLNRNGDWDCIEEEETNGIAEFIGQAVSLFVEDRPRECEKEPLLSGWTIFIDKNGNDKFDSGEDYRETDSDGKYRFEDLLAGSYRICEVMQTDWVQEYPGNPEAPLCHEVKLPLPDICQPQSAPFLVARISEVVEENILCEFNFGNTEESELYISETNDSWPNTLGVGDTFTYTIEVRAVNGPVNGAVMINLPPQGFEPQSGTFNAYSSLRGDLGSTGVVYASPGAWDLGDLKEDEVVTITYEAKVTDDVDPGIYPDVSFAQGKGMGGTDLLALSEGSGFAVKDGVVDENFVGTQVKIAVDTELNTDVDVKEEEEGEVLGASTELPATGASTFWVNLMLVLASIGGLLLLVGGAGSMKKDKEKTMKKGKKAILGLIALGFITLFSYKTYAASTVVRLSEPESPYGDEFDLVFVAMDINDPARELTAKCFVQKPGEVTFSATPFHTEVIPSTEVGDSRICPVGESILGDDGPYSFIVRVTPDGGTEVESNSVTVDYDGDGPDKPKYIEKEKVNDCVNKITLKTADDGETSSVRVYADDDKEIDIDDSHKIETESIGSDEKFSFEHMVSGDDCDKTWYYAVVAFDDAGNASKPRAEEITTTTTTTEEEETEAIPVEGGAGIVEGGVAGEGATGPEGAEGEEGEEALELDFGEGEEGSVLGEETAKEGKTLFKSPWFWIVAAGLGILIISAVKKSKKN